jgi:hypothetical protein
MLGSFLLPAPTPFFFHILRHKNTHRLELRGWCHFWRDPGCWPTSVINIPFLQPPGFESFSCWSDILPTTVRSYCRALLGNRSPLPGSAACGGPWNQEACTPDVILGSLSRWLKEAAELWTGPSDWWSETEIHARCPDQVGSPWVVSVRSLRGLILHRGLAKPWRVSRVMHLLPL